MVVLGGGKNVKFLQDMYCIITRALSFSNNLNPKSWRASDWVILTVCHLVGV